MLLCLRLTHKNTYEFTLDLKLTFEEHPLNVFKTVNRTIGLMRKLQSVLPRITLVSIYKAFVRPHLDYGDILYDQAFNNFFHDRLESIQYNACLAITGAIRGTPRDKLYQELGLEPLRLRRWYRRLCLFIVGTSPPSLLPPPLLKGEGG